METEDIDTAITLLDLRTNILNHEIIEPTQTEMTTQPEMLDKWKRISEQYRRKPPRAEPTQTEMTTQQEMLDKWKRISEQYRRKPPRAEPQTEMTTEQEMLDKWKRISEQYRRKKSSPTRFTQSK